MRKIPLILLALGAVVAFTFAWQNTASADGDDGNPPLGFGQKIAGGYYDEVWHEVPGGPSWPGWAVITLGADGTLTYKSVGPVGDQAGVGTWERTGNRQITAEFLLMGFQADEITGQAFGELVHSHSHQWTARSIVVIDFDEDYQCAIGIGCTDAFYPEEDPLESQNPFFSLDDVVHTIRKVNLIPCIGP